MNYYRCENPDCGFLAEEEPDVCPHCGGTFFLSVDEEELTGSDWVQLGNRAVDEERNTDALACYQQAAAAGDALGLTNLGWCLEAGVGVEADPRQAVVLYAQAAAQALLENTDLPAGEIAKKAIKIASDICIFTNGNITLEEV